MPRSKLSSLFVKLIRAARLTSFALAILCAGRHAGAQETPLLSGGVGFFTSTNGGNTTYQPIIEPLLAAPIGPHVLIESRAAVLESYAPGVTKRLGIDYDTLHQLNPRLVYCSITGYGRDNEHSQRPAYDALVAARTGLHWEQRGWPEGALNHLAGKLVLEVVELLYFLLQSIPLDA